MTNAEVCIKARSPPALLPFKGQDTEETTVKWSIAHLDDVFSDIFDQKAKPSRRSINKKRRKRREKRILKKMKSLKI